MISEIIKEKTSADHLLYVSLKYTKTCDIILNLIERWRSMLEMSFDALLERALEQGKIPAAPNSPKQRIEFMRKVFKKSQAIQDVIPIYLFFKRIPLLEKSRESEFRKNVHLRVIDGGEEVIINVDKLQEYAEVLEKFISEVKHLLS